MKAIQLVLWPIWLSGFIMISISIFATQRLSSSLIDQPHVHIRKLELYPSNDSADSLLPKVTIFTAPRLPFNGSIGARQLLALRSWLALSPHVTVVLFTQDSSAISVAANFSSRVSVDPDIDFTFLGTPFFHSMVAKSRAYLSDICVLVDPETVVLSDFISTLNHAYKLDQDWFLFAASRNVSSFPFTMDEFGKVWLAADGKVIRNLKLQVMLDQSWQHNHCEERILMAWNNLNRPLHMGVLPPFLFGKGSHNNWVINEVMSSNIRFILDASWTISSYYVNDEESHFDSSSENSRLYEANRRNWEYLGNSQLAAIYGASSFDKANYSNIVKILKCNNKLLLFHPAEGNIYPFSYQRKWKKRILSSLGTKKTKACLDVIESRDGMSYCSPKDHLNQAVRVNLPLSLESLLCLVADENKTVVLAIAGNSYKDMLMSWVCRLRHLMVSNFIVCALDEETYEFSVVQGLPVFKDSLAPQDISFDDCHFGTKCFQKVTKVKSRLVLQILKLGFNVLLSDVDVYWFKNPIPHLSSFGPAVLAAQSDEYNKTGPINLPRRLNSGFYFCHSDASTIAAMEKVVRHAATSDLSEQPSFYDTLCGQGGSYRVGDNRCFEPDTNVTVQFLDRNFFPNGAYLGMWERKNVKAACARQGCLILHNNWISGRRKKLVRQGVNGQAKRKKDFGVSPMRGASMSMDGSIQKTLVRIVHAGGRVELYQDAIPASHVMRKYPGVCVAKPDVFKNPVASLLREEDSLLPGNKYYLIPSTTANKLKRRHAKKQKARQSIEAKGNNSEGAYISDSDSDVSISEFSAKDYFVSKDKWKQSVKRHGVKGRKTHFVPPIPKMNVSRGVPWEPSLTSVIEVSP